MSPFNSFMGEALQQAQEAFKIDEVPVGAIVIDNKTNQIIGKAHNKNIGLCDATAHAEILALKEACKFKNNYRLDDCDLYVTLEPCPMCASAISLARIKRLYYGAEDKKSGGVDNGVRIFSSTNCHHKPEIYGGIGAQESKKLLESFFATRRK